MTTRLRSILLFILLIQLIACTPRLQPLGNSNLTVTISQQRYTTTDGVNLPLKIWSPKHNQITAVIIAIHGFNDYSNFFNSTGQFLSQQNIISYAYDQRGFGNSPHKGYWAGVETYISDLQNFIAAIQKKHPDKPVFLLGSSMGGAIVISTITENGTPPVAGIILSAPAIWARTTMPWYQNLLLSCLAYSMPWLTLTGKGLKIKPSDNIDMLRALGKDPLVIKETRVDAIYGLVNLMDKALNRAELINTKTLLLYGENDEIIPKKPTYTFLNNLSQSKTSQHTIGFYEQGYHMLLRDLNAKIIWHDIHHWIHSDSTSLLSGAEKRAQQLLNSL